MESKRQKTPQVERNPPKMTNAMSRNTTYNKVSSNSPSKRHSSGVIIRRRSFHGDGLLKKTKKQQQFGSDQKARHLVLCQILCWRNNFCVNSSSVMTPPTPFLIRILLWNIIKKPFKIFKKKSKMDGEVFAKGAINFMHKTHIYFAKTKNDDSKNSISTKLQNIAPGQEWRLSL